MSLPPDASLHPPFGDGAREDAPPLTTPAAASADEQASRSARPASQPETALPTAATEDAMADGANSDGANSDGANSDGATPDGAVAAVAEETVPGATLPGDAAPLPRAASAGEDAPSEDATGEDATGEGATGEGAHVAARRLFAALPRAVVPQALPDAPPGRIPLDHPALYFNRELSWLDFNWRVLAQAIDPRTPLAERVRFAGITANNLDEFYRKRVGGLKRQLAAGVRALSPDGRTPREQLELSLAAAREQHIHLCRVWERELRPALADVGARVLAYQNLPDGARAGLSAHFAKAIFPILTPLAVDPGHPFPFLSNLSLSLAFVLRHPARGTEHFARLKVPTARGRWLAVPGHAGQFVPLEEVIRHNAQALFKGMEVEGVYAFRVTRNADIERNEEEAEDLLAMISEELRERRFAEVVRLEVEQAMPPRVRTLLRRELALEPEDVVEVEGLLDLSGLMALADALDLPEHAYSPWEPVVPVPLRHLAEQDESPDIFSAIRRGDILVHHPFESFAASTQRFIEEAAADPQVLAIKLTLYRTSRNSPIVRALSRAAEQGKQVAALIEVKARFDEENNIEWAQQLERAGAHVAYGLVGLKTHCKTTLVVRQEGDALRTYAHVGTGNYNPATARFYTDIGLLTCREDVGADLVHLFHYLTGYAPEQDYKTLIVAPRDLRRRFVEMIRREAAHATRGRSGRIVAKMNALDDPEIIAELYRAGQAGASIDLIVRGHCRLRPGLPGFSERIRVRSIVGRFLEHSRIFYFHNDGAPEVSIGSADWMRRNLDERVEVVLPIRDPDAQGRLLRTLAFSLEDNRQAWDLGPDGRYRPAFPDGDEPERSLQETLMQRTRLRTEQDDAAWTF